MDAKEFIREKEHEVENLFKDWHIEKLAAEIEEYAERYHESKLKNNGDLGDVSERYPKDCVLEYEDGWYITFKSLSGKIIKSHGSYKTKAIAEHDRRTLNAR